MKKEDRFGRFFVGPGRVEEVRREDGREKSIKAGKIAVLAVGKEKRDQTTDPWRTETEARARVREEQAGKHGLPLSVYAGARNTGTKTCEAWDNVRFPLGFGDRAVFPNNAQFPVLLSQPGTA